MPGISMLRFEPNRYYRTDDPALLPLGTRGTLAHWRSKGEGPAYIRYGNRVFYRGADINAWLDSHVIAPSAMQVAPAAESLPA